MFEKIQVIPFYIAVLILTDSKKNLTWEQQVYLGTNYGQACDAACHAARKDWPDSLTELKAVVRHYHICADGTTNYVVETEV